jgi:7-dehydrocholesterol reductase
MIYFVFLTVLLFHRALRDQKRCLNKYGDGYAKYMKKVPYMVLPRVF